MVIYFSGTGNSRYVAQAIAERLEDEIVCSNDFIKRGDAGSFQSKKPWIFVFPIYISTVAKIFADFIRSAELIGSKRAYFIATCASYMGIAPNVCYNICNEKGLNYMGIAKVDMPQNYIAYFSMKEPQECKAIISSALPVIEDISKKIQTGEVLSRKLASKGEYDITSWCEKLYNKYFTKTDKFFATDECISCRICVNACPLNNISISESDGKPKWGKHCVHCMACINRCPKQAIEYGKRTSGKPRYVCVPYESSDKSSCDLD